MSNFKIGTKIKDEKGTGITAIVQSKRDPKTKEYNVLLTKPGYLPTMIRQKSLPKSPKEQDKIAKIWEKQIKKSGLKSKKCNKGVDYVVHSKKHSFRVSTTRKSPKKKSPKVKVFINPTTGRKFTITTVTKTRKSPKSKKRKKGGRRRKKSKGRRRRRRRTRKRK